MYIFIAHILTFLTSSLLRALNLTLTLTILKYLSTPALRPQTQTSDSDFRLQTSDFRLQTSDFSPDSPCCHCAKATTPAFVTETSEVRGFSNLSYTV